MATKDQLLEKVISLLRPHVDRKNETIDQFFTRQLHERICKEKLGKGKVDPTLPFLRLTEEQVIVREEEWPLEKLLVLPSWHERKSPQMTDQPLIVFRGLGGEFLIDGQNRVNLWRTQNAHGPHAVLVVEPRE